MGDWEQYPAAGAAGPGQLNRRQLVRRAGLLALGLATSGGWESFRCGGHPAAAHERADTGLSAPHIVSESGSADAVSTATYGVLNPDTLTLAQMRDWKAQGGTAVHVEAFWDRLQSSPGGALHGTDLAALNAAIDNAHGIGLEIYLSCAIQYPPQFVKDTVPPFRSQPRFDRDFVAGGPGEDIRDWVWSQAGRDHIADFIAKVLAGVDLTKIAAMRLGGGPYNEVRFPSPAGSSNDIATLKYWGYSSAARGIGLAAGMGANPDPAYDPYMGDAAKDAAFERWYLGSMARFVAWLVDRHRAGGWGGDIYVLHTSYLLRTGFAPTDWARLLEVAGGCDCASVMDAYKAKANVWPGCTWLDLGDQGNPSNDRTKAPWRKVRDEAVARGIGAKLYGENTGGGDNANMDAIFHGPMANGYTTLFWLSYAGLTAGTAGTMDNMRRDIAAAGGGAGAAPTAILYDFEADAKGWTFEGGNGATQTTARDTALAHDGGASLKVQKTDLPTGGYAVLRVSAPPTGPAAVGNRLAAFIRLAPGSAGTGWKARLEWQDSAWHWNAGASVDLVAGQWIEIASLFATLPASPGGYAIQFETGSPTAGAVAFNVDTFRREQA